MILTASGIISYYKPLVGVVKTNCYNWKISAGTASYEPDRGMVFGYNRIPYTYLEKKSPDFMDGFEQRVDISQVSHAAPLFPSDKQFERCE